MNFFKSQDGFINITFEPRGIRRANDNLFIIKSRFIQPCGSFEGSINTDRASPIHFSDVAWVVEEHHAKW